jgi:hypothetical protein
MCHISEDRKLETSCREKLKHQLGLFSLFLHSQNTTLPTLVNPLTPNDL